MRARALFFALSLLTACRSAPPGSEKKDGNGAPPTASHDARARLLDTENRRITGGVTDDDIGQADPALRRLAARAAARLGHPTAIPILQKALSDEDEEVTAWGAYGLGYLCRTEGVNGADVARALITRAVGLAPHGAAALDATFAITRALGHCASEEAEKTLVVWVTGPPPRASFAALALGDVAARRKELSLGAQRALLDAAEPRDGGAPIIDALFPFGRFDHPLAQLDDDLLHAATTALEHPGPDRVSAVRALSHVEKGAAPVLERVLTKSDRFGAPERAEAARGLGRLGDAGQKALYRALPSLVPADGSVALTSLGTSTFGPLIVLLESIRSPLHTPFPENALYDLANLSAPKDAPVTIVRRAVKLRCAAASLLVSGAFEDPLLQKCDPEPDGEIGERAELDVLGRRPIEGKRLARFRKLASSPRARVREAAIELLGAHAEIEDTVAIITNALAAKEPGVVATAAEFIAAHPQRVAADSQRRAAGAAGSANDGGSGEEAGPSTPEVSAKLKAAFERHWAPDDIETESALMEAAGATRLDAVTPALESFCRDANPTLREHAARALSLLKGPKTTCAAPAFAKDAARELDHLVSGAVKLELVTDAGSLEIVLDATHAPITATRITDLARRGFYNGIVAHRVVPGFVVQFGDPGSDGFGGPGLPPLRCETTPAPFGPFDVGVALSGRDTGSSQLFVTLSRTPHLDQEYAWVGHASGDWNAVAQGDVIREVRVH